MFYKVKKVKPLNNMEIEVEFINGNIKYYNVNNLIEKYDNFKKLLNSEFFKNVKVDIGGYGISWDDEVDISCNELWNNGYKK